MLLIHVINVNICKPKWKGKLKRQIESIHGNVMYSWDQCEYKAKQKIQLKRHKHVMQVKQ